MCLFIIFTKFLVTNNSDVWLFDRVLNKNDIKKVFSWNECSFYS